MNKEFYDNLDYYIKDVKCELNYNNGYELLIATILSAQCTDKRVNIVTKELFKKYDVFTMKDANLEDIAEIIKPCGTYNKKSIYLKMVSKSLVDNYNGIVPNNRKYLESLPGVGRKTVNVVLKNIYNEPAIPVDTHVERVSKRLGIVDEGATAFEVEMELMKRIPKDKWSRISEQILLFGRYYCKSVNPLCDDCKFKKMCIKKTSD